MTEDVYRQQVDARAREMLEAFCATDQCNSLWTCSAALACGTIPDELLDIAKKGIDYHGGPFNVFPAMALVCRWEDLLPADVVDHIRDVFTHGTLQRGNTENHWLMYYTGNLLAAERWADQDLLWNGLPPAAMQAEASNWILGMIARTAIHGHHEYDSTHYHCEHFSPYVVLADHARDPHLRHQAEQMLNLLVADMALEYFHGAWAGGHSREGYRQSTWTHIGPVQGLHHLYFGDEEFDPDRHCQTYVAPALTARYRPPALLARMALDRDGARVIRKTKAPRSIYRHVGRPAEPVRKYTYMSRSFALGTTQTGLPGPPAGPIDLVSWDLTWKGPRHQAKILCNHPYRSAGRFSAFLAELPQRIGRSVASGKPYLQFPDRLYGASPYERIMQHRGAAVILYQIPEEDEAPYVNLFLPNSHSWREEEGWMFADLDDFHVGVRPIGPYQWTDLHEASNAIMLTGPGDLTDGWLLRIEDLNAGLILEAVEAGETGGFDAYCRTRVDRYLDLSSWPGDGRVMFDTFQGSRMEMHYDGPHTVDGEVIDYARYPLYEAPNVDAPLGEGKMTFRHGEDRLDLDFGIDPQAPRLPMRVIG